MRQSRFTVEEIIRIVAESELPTVSIAGTARKYGITEATLYRWRAKYKGLSTSEAFYFHRASTPRTCSSSNQVSKLLNCTEFNR